MSTALGSAVGGDDRTVELLKADRLDALPPFLYMDLRRRVREARARGVDVINLAIGDPDQATPPHIVEALVSHHLALGVLNQGDVALVPDPAYPAYQASAIIAGAEVSRVPLRAENGFLMDFAEIPPRLATTV